MARMIILDSTSAAAIRGPTGFGSALDPLPLVDGSFALPLAVLSDPAHASRQNLLQGMPQGDVADPQWLVEGQP